MTILVTKLPSIEPEQANLPGLHAFLSSGGWVMNPYPVQEPADDPALRGPGPDQLHFGANQEPLSESSGEACQLPLLPDPPVWAAEPPTPSPRPRKGRRTRKRSNLGLSPGQMSLF
ncbi:hypothetical protein BH23ACT12_BH23ACT12_03840 [soil metagenome]